MSDGDLSALFTALSIPIGGLIAAGILCWLDRKNARKRQKP